MKFFSYFIVIYSFATAWSLASKSDLDLVTSLISDDDSFVPFSDGSSQYSYSSNLNNQDDNKANHLLNPYSLGHLIKKTKF